MKSLPLKIKAHARIRKNKVILDHKVLFEATGNDFPTFMKLAYKNLDTAYPKFFKMDGLSKIGFLAADLVLKNTKEAPEEPRNTALAFSNRAASLDTDRQHQSTIGDPENFYPSPAIFVYTLPNIVLGEISIRHMLHSENSFFIFNGFNATYLFNYAEYLIRNGKADEVLCGWVDLDGADYEAFVYLVSHEGPTVHCEDEILNLYTTT